MKKLILSLFIIIEYFSISGKLVAGENRSLYWESIYVEIKILNNGAIRITENLYYVFNGKWKGGYRDIKLHPGQSLKLLSLQRYYESQKAWKEIPEGDTEKIDFYEIEGKNKIKWRSRLENDPPFINEKIWYKLEYIINGKILFEVENGYHFRYDFLFPQRSGVVQYFNGKLTADPVWLYAGEADGPGNRFQKIDNTPVIIEAFNVEPGNSQHVNLLFRYTGNGKPLAKKSVTRKERNVLNISLASALIVILGWFVLDEYLRGRFKKIPRIQKKPDEGYMQEYVLGLLPEEVGALWDGKIGPPEVSAILARLVLENKIYTRIIYEKRFIFFPVRSLEVKLLQDKKEFQGYEKKLINGLFIDGNITTPEKVRKYYRSKNKSFNAVATITDQLENELKKNKKLKDDDLKTFDWAIPLLFFAGALVVTVISIFTSFGTIDVILSSIFTTGIVTLISWFVFLRNLRYRLRYPLIILMKLFSGLFFPAVTFIGLIDTNDGGFLSVLAAYLWVFAVLISFVFRSRTKNPPGKLEFRRNLLAIRTYWKNQLRSPDPDLKDEYFPYLMAMGLAPYIDRWSSVNTGSLARGYSSIGTGTGPSSSWSGGGGSFGGAGAAGTWSAAGSSFAGISVSASSSGSGSSGGGGGGGGGW